MPQDRNHYDKKLALSICLTVHLLLCALLGFGQIPDSAKTKTNAVYIMLGTGSMHAPGNTPMLSLSLGIDFEHKQHSVGARSFYGYELKMFGGDYNDLQAYRLHYGYSFNKGHFAITPLIGLLYVHKSFYEQVEGGFISGESTKYQRLSVGHSFGIASGISGQLIKKHIGIGASLNGAYAGKLSFFNWDFSVVVRIGK